MKSKRWTFEILAILAVAAVLSWFVREPASDSDFANAPSMAPAEVTLSPTEVQEALQQWQDHYAMAQSFLEKGDLPAAERELLNAEKIALLLPAGDKSLAETLDDLGHVQFKMGKPEMAMQFQGRAVAALLLAGGPQNPELEIYLKRYGWALKGSTKDQSKARLLIYDPLRFLASHPTGVSAQRFEKELNMLESDYQKLGDSEALAVIARLRSHK